MAVVVITVVIAEPHPRAKVIGRVPVHDLPVIGIGPVGVHVDRDLGAGLVLHVQQLLADDR